MIDNFAGNSEGRLAWHAKTVVGWHEGQLWRHGGSAGKAGVVEPLSGQAALDTELQRVHVGMQSSANPRRSWQPGRDHAFLRETFVGGNNVFASADAQVHLEQLLRVRRTRKLSRLDVHVRVLGLGDKRHLTVELFRLRKAKRPSHFRDQGVCCVWLPDLGSNQGPTD
jgi:hypothetical protein